MIWVAVNKDETELISNTEMGRASEWLDRCVEFDSRYSMYINKCSGIWSNSYTSGYFECPTFDGVVLPKGTIKRLIGKDMTWEDEPIQIKDYE